MAVIIGTATGNILNGTNASDTISGLQGNDVLSGGNGNDFLYGGAGVDWLNGGDGNDWLDGGLEGDLMAGGQGNDFYVVDNVGDKVLESADGGVDSVRASISYTLGNHLENLYLSGSANLSGTGNDLDNLLQGNQGDNLLNGMAGNDTLIGYGYGSYEYDTLTGGLVQTSLFWGIPRERFISGLAML